VAGTRCFYIVTPSVPRGGTLSWDLELHRSQQRDNRAATNAIIGSLASVVVQRASTNEGRCLGKRKKGKEKEKKERKSRSRREARDRRGERKSAAIDPAEGQLGQLGIAGGNRGPAEGGRGGIESDES